MCLFGGGSSAPTRDLEAEAAQKAERERQEAEKTKLKTQQTESQVKKSQPLVQYIQSPSPQKMGKPEEEKGEDTTTARLEKDLSDLQKRRSSGTRLMRRRRARGRRSLLVSTGMGFNRGNY
tara:strand:- start:3850 stop:4212 length:363 start_codon:yes stop_codon:yes gene_type:complete